MWAGGTVPPKTMNVAACYLLLLALFILTSIVSAKFLAQTISEINTKQKLMLETPRPPYCTTRRKVMVRTDKCQPEVKHQNKESNGKLNFNDKLKVSNAGSLIYR